jgi:hypothetical protein
MHPRCQKIHPVSALAIENDVSANTVLNLKNSKWTGPEPIVHSFLGTNKEPTENIRKPSFSKIQYSTLITFLDLCKLQPPNLQMCGKLVA